MPSKVRSMGRPGPVIGTAKRKMRRHEGIKIEEKMEMRIENKENEGELIEGILNR